MVKISEAEMEIMNLVWMSDKPITSNEMLGTLPKNKWKITTVLTLATRLIDKGFLKSEKIGRSHQYSPLVSKTAYKQICTKNFLEEIHQGSIKNFFAALYSDSEISQSDLDDLRAILDKKED